MGRIITPETRRKRLDLTVNPKTKKWLKEIAKKSRLSIGQIIDRFVEDRMIPKLEKLKEERKKLVVEMNALSEQINFLEDRENEQN